MKSEQVFDVIVVGSGIAGGWAAKEFCRKGLKTLLIERGPMVKHREDYKTEGMPPWKFPYSGLVSATLIDEKYKIQSRNYAFNDSNKHFFGNDMELPYENKKGTDFTWIRGNQLGGKSLLWERQCYRWSDFNFRRNAEDGYGVDWPIRYQDLADWYSLVERNIGVSGSRDNLPQLPDGEFLKPFDLTKPEQHLKKAIADAFPDLNMVVGRTAHLTEPAAPHMALGRSKCMARNECRKGCSFGAYFSSLSSSIPEAQASGNLTLMTDAVVDSLIYDEKAGRALGVNVLKNKGHEQKEVLGKLIFLCASTVGSTQILLNSKSKSFPNGLANSSGVLGHYLMDHNYNASIKATIPGFEEEYYFGRRPTGIYIPDIYWRSNKGKHKNFLRSYSFAGRSYRENWEDQSISDGFDPQSLELLTRPGKWKFALYPQGEMLPRYENNMSLHPYKKDAWGMPQIIFECRYSQNELQMMEDAVLTGRALMKAVGLSEIQTEITSKTPGHGVHEVGTARMGRDPKSSVLNGYNQAHDVPNVFVTDGASFCSTSTHNPSLTIMALTARAVDYAVVNYNKIAPHV